MSDMGNWGCCPEFQESLDRFRNAFIRDHHALGVVGIDLYAREEAAEMAIMNKAGYVMRFQYRDSHCELGLGFGAVNADEGHCGGNYSISGEKCVCADSSRFVVQHGAWLNPS